MCNTDPVPQPKEEEVNAELSKLNAQITTWDKRLTEIKSAIEKANTIRDNGTVSQSWECVSAIAAMVSGSGCFFGRVSDCTLNAGTGRNESKSIIEQLKAVRVRIKAASAGHSLLRGSICCEGCMCQLPVLREAGAALMRSRHACVCGWLMRFGSDVQNGRTCSSSCAK